MLHILKKVEKNYTQQVVFLLCYQYYLLYQDNFINENNNIHSHRMFAEFKKFVEVINNKDFKFMNNQKEHTLNVMYIYEKAKKFIEN